MTLEPASYPRHRFPAEIISHAVWLYHVFSLSLRDVELILAERGIVVTHESIRAWCLKFGSDFARKLRRRRPQPGDTWHLDEVFIRIRGVLHYLWRAVDQHGVVLDILVQGRRNGVAAKRFFKHLLHGSQYKPRRLVTDGLRSYGVAQRAILPDVRHRTSRYLNNRAENSHRPTRRRKRQMQRFKSASQAQRFLSAHAMIYGHFRPRRGGLMVTMTMLKSSLEAEAKERANLARMKARIDLAAQDKAAALAKRKQALEEVATGAVASQATEIDQAILAAESESHGGAVGKKSDHPRSWQAARSRQAARGRSR